MRFRIFMILGVLIVFLPLYSYELDQLVDMPTAGILQKGEAMVSGKIYRQDGLLTGAKVGLFPRFMFGVSYGGENIVGNKSVEWHDKVEFNAKFRLFDETEQFPALALGIDTQGHGVYHEELKRYDIKSKGFYAVASRNYLFLGNLGLHGGLNYSLETKDNDRDLNCFLGIDKSVGDMVTLTCEYDMGFNDNRSKRDQKNTDSKGYLNASLILKISENFDIRFVAYDMLENGPETVSMDRALKINYYFTF